MTTHQKGRRKQRIALKRGAAFLRSLARARSPAPQSQPVFRWSRPRPPTPLPNGPELNPDFAGVPSVDFITSGQPLYATPSGGQNTRRGPGRDDQPASVNSLTQPNLLIIMVDQLWNGLWLPNNGSGVPSTATIDALCPNLAFLRDNSIRFLSFFGAACSCTPSRGTFLTGLYAPQQKTYITQGSPYAPDLHLMTNGSGQTTGFSTFGTALQDPDILATPYNTYWFGKWHLSNENGNETSLVNYGFTWEDNANSEKPSPNGLPNEGQQPQGGGAWNWGPPPDPSGCTQTPVPPFSYSQYYESDIDIQSDFVAHFLQSFPLVRRRELCEPARHELLPGILQLSQCRLGQWLQYCQPATKPLSSHELPQLPSGGKLLGARRLLHGAEPMEQRRYPGRGEAAPSDLFPG